MPEILNGQELTLRNPDGTAFVVRGWGDQQNALFETLDGYTVIRDRTTGYWRYAIEAGDGHHLLASDLTVGRDDPKAAGLKLRARMSLQAARSAARRLRAIEGPSRWEQRLAARQSIAAAPRTTPYPFGSTRGHTVGDYVGLCIPIDFPNVPAQFLHAQVEEFCNRIGYTDFGNNGSVRDYFFDVSDGKLSYTNRVTRYYTAANRKEYYTDESVPEEDKKLRAKELIVEALTWLVEQDFDFSDLSADEDGYIYALNVFYAGSVDNNWSWGLWPHSSHLSQPFELADGRRFNDYQITAMEDELTIGVFCHESGHLVCNFPDLYDRDLPPEFKSSGAGRFTLMAAGDTADRKNPVQVDAYLKNLAGWTSSIEPLRPGMSVQLTAGKNDFCIYARTLDEFFIIENRQQAGRDSALDASGVTIWHVEQKGSNSDEDMTPEHHYRLSLEQADGRFDLEAGENKGDAGDLFSDVAGIAFADTTTPNSRWWDGSGSGLSIEQVSPVGATMTFVVSGGRPPPTTSYEDLLIDRRQSISQIVSLLLG
jgi:M6 family metalloprotease-like protein